MTEVPGVPDVGFYLMRVDRGDLTDHMGSSIATRSSGFWTTLWRFVLVNNDFLFVLIVTSGPQKKCLEDSISEDSIAVAHDDDLQFIKDVVRPKSKCRNLFLKSTNNAPA